MLRRTWKRQFIIRKRRQCDPEARHNLGCLAAMNGRYERARKHFIIAANLGYHDSLQNLMGLYADGHARKEVMQVLFVDIRLP